MVVLQEEVYVRVAVLQDVLVVVIVVSVLVPCVMTVVIRVTK